MAGVEQLSYGKIDETRDPIWYITAALWSAGTSFVVHRDTPQAMVLQQQEAAPQL
jgi:hypothetical protein